MSKNIHGRRRPSAGLKPSASLKRLAAALCLPVLGILAIAGPAQAATTLPTLSLAITATSITAGAPPQSGAVNVVTTTAAGVKEADATLILLKPGVSVAEVDAFLATNGASKDPNTVSKFGSIVFDGEAAPGTDEAQTYLLPGQYVALGAGEGASSKWPRTSFTVAPSPSPIPLPAAQATLRTIEFGFKGPAILHTGELVRAENEGYVVHMDIAFPVKSRKAAIQVAKALLTGKGEKRIQKLIAGPPITFQAPASSGAVQQETLTAKPGWYVQACFMATQDGKEHTRLGMERIIKVVK